MAAIYRPCADPEHPKSHNMGGRPTPRSSVYTNLMRGLGQFCDECLERRAAKGAK